MEGRGDGARSRGVMVSGGGHWGGGGTKGGGGDVKKTREGCRCGVKLGEQTGGRKG